MDDITEWAIYIYIHYFTCSDVIPDKNTKGMSNAEKNKRRRKLFLKMKRNVNATGGNNRRKKSLFYKFTDHKNCTKDKVLFHYLFLKVNRCVSVTTEKTIYIA